MRLRPLSALPCLLPLLVSCVAEPQQGGNQEASAATGGPAGGYVPSKVNPPAITREFRGGWVASVFNIDWPSSSGLSATRQKAEMIAILDKAQSMNMNAIILQVRPACDALYNSSYEPWAAWLTGTMGRSPGYDPLQFAIQEAHARGIELHAWFNPFRALASARQAASAGHVTKRHPSWVRRFEDKVWLDPGLPEVRNYAIKVIMDVVSRYDVDGIHIDDYFYPYPKNPSARPIPEFPDAATFRRYGGGKDRHDWRRANIDSFVSGTYAAIKRKKPWVKFGISPFGVWRPQYPRGVKADLDSYRMIYGDSRSWLRNGWCDYMSPQLYWPIRGDQSFSSLLSWWDGENVRGRHVWPGIASDRVGAKRPASEQGNQIRLTRATPRKSAGHIHWSIKPVMQNKRGLANLLERSYYTDGALVPAIPWSSGSRPGRPGVAVRTEGDGGSMYIDWKPGAGSPPTHWVVQTRTGGKWAPARVVAARKRGLKIDLKRGSTPPEVISVTAANRFGNTSAPAVLERR